MKILLDTNIVVYRESDNSTMDGIGELFKIIENNMQMQKYISPIIKKEILQNVHDKKRDILLNRLNSYNMLENPSKNICQEIENKFSNTNKTINDKIDDLILTEVYTGKVDLLITEDKRLKDKAVQLGITEKVKSISEFIYKNKMEKKVNHSILEIHKVKIDTLNINDSFFDGLKNSYPGFEAWLETKKNEDAYCYFENNKLLAMLLLKNEEIGEDYSDISPSMKQNRKLKISTFKVDIEHKKIGERFMKIVFDQAIYSNVDEIYVTIFDDDYKKKNLISYLEKFGFQYHGKKKGKELVYIRKMNKQFIKDNPLKSYPYFSRECDSFVIPILPKYHTYLLPDSKLSRESYKNIHMPVEYAIKKYYVSAAGFKPKPKIGDNLVFYRTSEGIIPAKYSSVLTTIGVVTDVYIPRDVNDLLKKIKNKTVYSDEEIIDYYTKRMKNTYVVEFAYIATLGNKINLNDCLINNILSEHPRSIEPISKYQFSKIIELGNVDSSIVI
mgnify:CR=1 FL=1